MTDNVHGEINSFIMKGFFTKIVDVPVIRQKIHESHQKFMSDFGLESDKVVAEHRLQLYKIWNKILLIAKCLRDENVISSFENVSSESSYLAMKLNHNLLENHVYIYTDGKTIVLQDSGFKVASKLEQPRIEVMYNVDEEGYDWVKFS
ncbi:MAG: hypothetical protein WC375_12970, partial [Methanomassiliicoccales archaeon]